MKHWIHFLLSSLWPPTSNMLGSNGVGGLTRGGGCSSFAASPAEDSPCMVTLWTGPMGPPWSGPAGCPHPVFLSCGPLPCGRSVALGSCPPRAAPCLRPPPLHLPRLPGWLSLSAMWSSGTFLPALTTCTPGCARGCGSACLPRITHRPDPGVLPTHLLEVDFVHLESGLENP